MRNPGDIAGSASRSASDCEPQHGGSSEEAVTCAAGALRPGCTSASPASACAGSLAASTSACGRPNISKSDLRYQLSRMIYQTLHELKDNVCIKGRPQSINILTLRDTEINTYNQDSTQARTIMNLNTRVPHHVFGSTHSKVNLAIHSS